MLLLLVELLMEEVGEEVEERSAWMFREMQSGQRRPWVLQRPRQPRGWLMHENMFGFWVDWLVGDV